MYSIIKDNYAGGAFKSLLDNKFFEFVKTPDGSDRRRAAREMEQHNAAIIAEREHAAGRRLTAKELREGIFHPDNRSALEKIQDSKAARTNEIPPDNSDWAARHLAKLRANPGFTPEQRAQNARRIEMYTAIVEKQKEEGAVNAAEAERADNPKVQRAIDHAKTIIERNKFDGAVSQAEVEAAQRRLALAESGDYATYWQSYLPIMRERDAKILAAVRTVQTRAAAMEAGAEEIKLTGQIPPDVLAEMDWQGK
jgi:hypothetical protein